MNKQSTQKSEKQKQKQKEEQKQLNVKVKVRVGRKGDDASGLGIQLDSDRQKRVGEDVCAHERESLKGSRRTENRDDGPRDA